MIDQQQSAPAQTVLWIVSQWYSGSSILNLLLDQQEGIRGLGECYHIYTGKRDCYCSCGHSLSHCAFFQTISSDKFYEQCFSRYDCSVLVDASKTLTNFGIARDPQFATRAVVLSKTPHAWLYSYLHHHPDKLKDIVELLRGYLSSYQFKLDQLVKEGIPFSILTYEDLIRHPFQECQRLCQPFAIAVDPETMIGPWRTDTHISGGNQAVFHQLQAETSFFTADSKYHDKKNTLFLDESWKEDREFRMHCADVYRVLEPVIDPILEQLGHLSSRALAEDVDVLPTFHPVGIT